MQWYLARDGKQHGPLSDTEMRKFVELGHLRPTDLVWRAGFAEWRPGPSVFPEMRSAPAQPAAAAAAGTETAAAPAARRQPAVDRTAPRQVMQRQPLRPAEPAGAPQDFRPSAPLSARLAAQQAASARAPAPAGSAAGGPGFGGPGPAGMGRVPAPGTRLAVPGARGDALEDEEEVPVRRSGSRRWLVAATVVGVAGLGAWGAWNFSDTLPGMSAVGSVLRATLTSSPTPEQFRVPPFVSIGETRVEIDGSLQKAALWRVLKREFPEWYAERIAEVEKLREQKADERATSKYLADTLVQLRRQHAKSALAASPDHLRQIATTFLANLKQLASRDAQSCYGFISFGEANPFILELSKTPAFGEPIHRQLTAVFEAASDGRKSPQEHGATRRTDYDMLTSELTALGWSQDDLITFSDPRRLSGSPPPTVCKMVQDWFSAHLNVKDAGSQTRLLSESLRPLVHG